MTRRTAALSESFGFSRLYCDYVAGGEALTGFFASMSLSDRAGAAARAKHKRDAIVEILERQNRAWSAPKSVMDAIVRLGDDRAIIVCAGQQAGLFGGPYMTLIKALAAVKWARETEKRLRVPVIPLFWVAADDHDFDEIAAVDFFDMTGKLQRISIDPATAHPPVGALGYDESIDRAVEQLASILPDNEFKQELVVTIRDIYGQGRCITDCFARLMLTLAGNLGVVLFNPYDARFKSEIAEILQRIIIDHKTIKALMEKTERNLLKAGYHIQVQKAPTAAHMFHHNPDRVPIHREGDMFVAGERRFSERELVEAISAHPLDFSTDALTRPLVQSFFFPTLAVIGGPAEIAYYAQMMPLYESFEIVPPAVIARPSITLVEKRFEHLMDAHQLSFDDLAGDFELVINRVMERSFPRNVEDRLKSLGSDMRRGMEGLRGELKVFERDLSGAVDQTAGKIDYLLAELRKKVFAEYKRKQAVERERLYRFHENMFPHRGPAERSINALYFWSRYGRGVVDFLHENMSLEETGHQLLLLSEYYGQA